MRLSPRWQRCALAALATTLLAPVTGVAAPAAADPRDRLSLHAGDPLLPRPMHGRRAVERLGPELGVSAARNDLRTAELRSLLRTDDTAWVDEGGDVLFVEPAAGTDAAPSGQAPAAAPLEETFVLHSNPGADRSIFLDFDGADVSGTSWNSSNGVAAGFHPGWDPTGDGPAFNDAERALVQQVWAIVAEDYAPFDVDVTTEDPGAAGLVRRDAADPTYGTRVLVSPSDDAFSRICQRSCGGVAYLGVFGETGSSHQPAWVFPQGTGNTAKGIAEAAAHEAGHNLGLQHDGTSAAGYYSGHGVWAPIMGVGYYKPVSQWSAGSYVDANNPQDDVSTIRSYLGSRPDEASNDVTLPSSLPAREAVIGDAADVDAFDLGHCAAGSAVEVSPAALAPDLDVRAVLLDGAGTQRAAAEPTASQGDGTTAAGLGGELTVPEVGDGWVLSVEGVGEGTWGTNGYDDYGSLGAYTVSAPGCSATAPDGVPAAPEQVTPRAATSDSLTLTWAPPATTGAGEVTGYVVSRTGSPTGVTLPATARSHTFTGLTPGSDYQLSVRAVNAAGAGPTVTVDARTAEPPASAPSSPRDLTGSYDPADGKLQVWWTEPSNSGSQPITGYAIYLAGKRLGQFGPGARGAAITSPTGFPAGDYVVGVAAVNAVGESPVARVTITRPAVAPSPPASVAARPGDARAIVTWPAASDNGSPITRYAVTASPGGRTCGTVGALTCTVTGLTNGTAYTFTVVATNAGGDSAPSPASAPVTPAGLPGTVTPRVAVRGRTAVVTWGAASPNGSAVSHYLVDLSTGRDRDVPGTSSSVSLRRMQPGRYRVRVAARNAVGTAPQSAWVRFRVR